MFLMLTDFSGIFTLHCLEQFVMINTKYIVSCSFDLWRHYFALGRKRPVFRQSVSFQSFCSTVVWHTFLELLGSEWAGTIDI